MIATGGPGRPPGTTGGGDGVREATGGPEAATCSLGREVTRIATALGCDHRPVFLALLAAVAAAAGPGPHLMVHDRRVPAIIWSGLVGRPDRTRRVIDAVLAEMRAATPSLPVAEVLTIDALVELLTTTAPDPRALAVVTDLAGVLHEAAGDPTARSVLTDAWGGGRRHVGILGAATPAGVRRLFSTPPGAELGALILWGAT